NQSSPFAVGSLLISVVGERSEEGAVMSDPKAPDTSINDPDGLERELHADGPPFDPLTVPSVEQPTPPLPGGDEEESISLEPAIGGDSSSGYDDETDAEGDGEDEGDAPTTD